ncbi:hypothetical protein [Streptococcus sobrinus]|uniref:ABC transporter permease n=2 Tax=Streptococcus sobrinus TaxID=1310 RepID=A0ABM6W3H2_9STRE|nr:hypothetical protein [Streptococcus sobrinus]AWN20156.1 hypothetical protein DK182_01825 [Streptococcus sobrinus]EMP71715.1 ABC transporter permease [Streptococcus sobrinus DSM 20742 = ATCC 33478]SQG12874.1 ABC transporter permease [Streptococcus sobrinus]
MNWSNVWELVKINILYSNPQNMSQIKKKREKNPGKQITAYKSVIRQQLLLMVIMTVLFTFTFAFYDFKTFPGLFSQYFAAFFCMSIMNGLSSMFSIFYRSQDLKLYAHLPLNSKDIYLAKILSTSGLVGTFLLPILPLLISLAWQLYGPLGLLPAILLFVLASVSSLIIGLVLNHLIGRVAIKSRHGKLFSTLLLAITSIGALAIWFWANSQSTSLQKGENIVISVPQVPIFRGYYDILVHPFSLATLVNFVLPLVFILICLAWLIKKMYPRYYQETLFATPKQNSTKRRSNGQSKSLRRVWIRHHLSPLQDGNLITQAFIMPLVFPLAFGVGIFSNTSVLSKFSGIYFGIPWIVGLALGALIAMPSTFFAVGISLEKTNYLTIKSLPVNFKDFLKQKFIVLAFVQLAPLVLVYLVVGLLVHINLINLLVFLLGFVLSSLIFGQFMYRRDYYNLVLNWKDLTQLINRGGGQWFIFGVMMATFLVGGIAVGITIALISLLGGLVAGLVILLLSLIAAGIIQFLINRTFWKALD